VRKKPPPGGGGGSRTYEDHKAHAEVISKQVDAALAERSVERPGKVDPRAILLIKLNRPVSDSVWAAVDLVEFDGRALEATVAFSTRVDLSAFLERLAKYRAAVPSKKGSLVGADLSTESTRSASTGRGTASARGLRPRSQRRPPLVCST